MRTYKIKKVGKDANRNITIGIEYTDGERTAVKTFNFLPTVTKEDIFKTFNDGFNLSEISNEEQEKKTICESKIIEMADEVDKEQIIIHNEDDNEEDGE